MTIDARRPVRAPAPVARGREGPAPAGEREHVPEVVAPPVSEERLGPRPDPDPAGYPPRHARQGARVPGAPLGAPLLLRTAVAHVLRAAADAAASRREADPEAVPGIRVTSAGAGTPLVVLDDGAGLSEAQVRRLFRDGEDVAAPTGLSVDDLVQLDGLAVVVRACLRVAERVEVRTSTGAEATTLRAVAHRDGPSRVELAEEPLPRSGTEVRLCLDPGLVALVDAGAAPSLVTALVAQLDVPVAVDGRPVAAAGPVWGLPAAELEARFAGQPGGPPLAVLDLGPGPGGSRAVAVVPAGPVGATRTRGQQVHLDGVLVPDGRARLLPPWAAALCTVVLDAGMLPLTPDADALAAGAALDAVAEHLGSALRAELALLADRDPARFAAVVTAHGPALRQAAGEHPALAAAVQAAGGASRPGPAAPPRPEPAA